MTPRKQHRSAHIIALGLLAAIPGAADAFVVAPSQARCSMTATFAEGGIDVSDLGLTMDDLNAPLPEEAFQLTKSGTESTSRVPGVEDDGCVWEETADMMDVTLSIPGLRGQPPAALTLDITKNTATITAFGFAVWSCILRGNCDPETVSFSATDGADMVPLITISVKKLDKSQRWDGFILQCGEDSIL
mmetsp:Transcript_24028/g.69048  ORF Transcript_24028/g.69048 Transcript_24028/m.69048 type:complete len:189 (-) Transcript_24028:842-1408(-)|eukprot:CAMPEP_0181038462 /NCGR_PEP_ID=MMETSP1070-20121207/9943_1 /TAXON_ID=265543 /ORGANISM="Minutocellus polymorphus, Strain NH13" /LENGTH=188 /DNA_ID=CAMNT_0023116237 /DNA_START=36 /DNA_END=602 /DNA_ORIENTATION=+